MMRQGGQGGNKRGRGRGPGGGGNPQHNGGGNNGGGNRRPHIPNRNQNFDSNGPDVRIRGSAYQVHEKYLNLARDATAAGDRIMAESYYQHAEHYYRIINAQEYGPDDQRRPRNDGYNNDGGQNQQNGFNGEEPQPYFGNNESENGEQAENREPQEFQSKEFQQQQFQGQDSRERDNQEEFEENEQPE